MPALSLLLRAASNSHISHGQKDRKEICGAERSRVTKLHQLGPTLHNDETMTCYFPSSLLRSGTGVQDAYTLHIPSQTCFTTFFHHSIFSRAIWLHIWQPPASFPSFWFVSMMAAHANSWDSYWAGPRQNYFTLKN